MQVKRCDVQRAKAEAMRLDDGRLFWQYVATHIIGNKGNQATTPLENFHPPVLEVLVEGHTAGKGLLTGAM